MVEGESGRRESGREDRHVRIARALAAVPLVGIVIVVLDVTPAAAHTLAGSQPTNYEVVVRGVEPAQPGIQVHTVDLGQQLELRNTTAHDIVVLGDLGEPYLRVGPDGAFENTRSPTIALNRSQGTASTTGTTARPNAASAPRWRRLGPGVTLRWHDRRASWSGTSVPTQTAPDTAGRRVVVPGWRIPLDIGARRLNIVGDIVWVPGPSPWPWALTGIAVAGTVGLLGRSRWWPFALGAGLVTVIVTIAVQVAGSWDASTAGTLSNALGSAYAISGWALATAALVLLTHHGPRRAAPAVFFAAFFATVAVGLPQLSVLDRSQISTTLPADAARVLVALTTGAGIGLFVAAAQHLALTPEEIRGVASGTD